MLMVNGDPSLVEAALLGGGLTGSCCGGVLGPWAYARPRTIRWFDGELVLRPRRARCRECGATHVLLPDGCLLRRRDRVEVIGSALVQHAAGSGHRPIAARLGVPAATVRGWLRRFRASATETAQFFLRWFLVLAPASDLPAPTGTPIVDAVGAIGLAARAAIRRFGPAGPWHLAGRLTRGGLLSNASSLWSVPV